MGFFDDIQNVRRITLDENNLESLIFGNIGTMDDNSLRRRFDCVQGFYFAKSIDEIDEKLSKDYSNINNVPSITQKYGNQDVLERCNREYNIELRNLPDSANVDKSSYQKFVDTYESRTINLISRIIDDIIVNINDIINVGGAIKKDRIQITQDDRGIFDFSLAAQGLIRPVEFFSQKLKDQIDSGQISNPYKNLKPKLEVGVVPPELVRKIKNLFYVSFLGEDYACERRQKGASKVFENFPDKCILKTTADGIVTTFKIEDQKKVFNGEGKIRLKYASTNKKSYLLYTEKPESVKNVDLFVPMSFLTGANTTTRLKDVFIPLLLSDILEKYGIETSIYSLRVGTSNRFPQFPNENLFNSSIIPLKSYSEKTSEKIKKIGALFSGGNAIFLGMYTNYADYGNATLQEYRNLNYIYRYELVGYSFINYMNAYNVRMFNFIQQNPTLYTGKVKKESHMISTSLKNRSLGRTSAINNRMFLDHIHFIFFNVYFYIDSIALDMNDLSFMIKMINDRFRDNFYFQILFEVPNSDQYKLILRKYMNLLMQLKYNSSEKFGDEDQYGDTPQQTKEKEDKFDEKIKEINEIINEL